MEDWVTALERTPDAEEFTLLVAVGDPDYVPQLMRTATDIAAFEGGSVHVVSVVREPRGSGFGVFTDRTIVEKFGGDRKEILQRAVEAGTESDVAVSGSVVVARRASDGILDAIDQVEATAALVGWHGTVDRGDTMLGTTVDRLLERAPADVLVERIESSADGVESVLVPVAGSPHAALAARVGSAIAIANDARLLLLAVATDDTDAATAREYVERTERALLELWAGPGRADTSALRVDGVVSEGEDVADVIVETAADHDIVLMGVTRSGALRRRLVGSTPLTVADRTETTTLLAQRSTGGSRVRRLLGRLRRS